MFNNIKYLQKERCWCSAGEREREKSFSLFLFRSLICWH